MIWGWSKSVFALLTNQSTVKYCGVLGYIYIHYKNVLYSEKKCTLMKIMFICTLIWYDKVEAELSQTQDKVVWYCSSRWHLVSQFYPKYIFFYSTQSFKKSYILNFYTQNNITIAWKINSKLKVLLPIFLFKFNTLSRPKHFTKKYKTLVSF